MERKVLKKWKKIGGGSFLLNGNRWIKPGQEFMALESDIPEAFRDTIIPLEVETKKEELTNLEEGIVTPPIPPKFSLKRRGASRWYDVVNDAGKAINDKPLSKEDAEKLKTSIEGENL